MSALEQAEEHARPQVERIATPQPGITLGDTILKWYEISRDDAPVPLVIRALARRCLRDGYKAGTLEVDDSGLGFVVLHRCDDDFYVLLVSTWQNENELLETVWAKRGEADALFRPWARDDTRVPTFCVRELGAVAHERLAWATYLRSARDQSALREYLRDCYAGVV